MYGYPIYTWLFPLKAFKQVHITLCNGGETRLHPLYAGGCSHSMTLLNYPLAQMLMSLKCTQIPYLKGRVHF